MKTPLQDALKGKLLTLMMARVVVAIAFLGIIVYFQLKSISPTHYRFYPLYMVVITIGIATILYAFLIHRVKDLRRFARVQISIDIVIITFVVYITGGVTSYLSILYHLSIIAATILLGRSGGIFAASLSSAGYAVLLDLDFYHILPQSYKLFHPQTEPIWDDVLTTIAINILSFFTVAYLTGYLAQKTTEVERELEEKEIDFGRLKELNQLIVDNIPAGVMTLNDQKEITSFNRAATDITGYTLKDVYHRDVEGLFPGITRKFGNPGMRSEMKLQTSGKDRLILGFSVSRGQGEDMAWVVIFQDLTQLKSLEEELRRSEKLRALGELSASLAHEIRNPLASISGSIQVMKDELEPIGYKSNLMDIILRETRRLNSLITDFLLFARPPAEKMEKLNLSLLVSDIIDVLRHNPEAEDVEIESSLGDYLYIDGNQRQLSQVIWNLMLNAVHSMDGRGRLVIRSAGCKDDSVPLPLRGKGRFVVVSMEDTGKGIEPENLGRIFDPFFSTKPAGTGLGLSIAYRIIESHGGLIDVSSTPGKGTIFKIYLPVHTPREIKEQRGGI